MRTLQIDKIVDAISKLENLIEKELEDGDPKVAQEYIEEKERLESKLERLQLIME